MYMPTEEVNAIKNNKKRFILIGVFLIAIITIILFIIGAFDRFLPSNLKSPLQKKAVVGLKTTYENPFDKKTQYVNPFQENKNPFVTNR